MFYFQKNGLYPVHLHSKGQKTTDIAKPSKRTPASSSTLQNYIYTHIQSQLFLCWWEHAYITCLGETLRKGNKRFQNSCTSVTWWAKHRAGTQGTTGWYWVSHAAQWLTELGLWNWLHLGQELHTETLLSFQLGEKKANTALAELYEEAADWPDSKPKWQSTLKN